jgi:hypothetical protein
MASFVVARAKFLALYKDSCFRLGNEDFVFSEGTLVTT